MFKVFLKTFWLFSSRKKHAYSKSVSELDYFAVAVWSLATPHKTV